MTGRRLYDALTDAWSLRESWNRNDGVFLLDRPPAWAFLAPGERKAFNDSARALTPKPRKKDAE